MLRNYLTTALRNFRKNRFYAFVNVFGLAIGISCCLVVYTILKHELTFDSWHKDIQNLYRIVEHTAGDYGMKYSGVLPNPMPEAVDKELSGIQSIPMMGPVSGTIEFNLNGEYQAFEEEAILYATGSFLELLDFPIKRGAGPGRLDELNKVFLTEKVAEKYFRDQEPIGQIITLAEELKLEVVGILENTPTNTSTPFDILVSFETRLAGHNSFLTRWDSDWSSTCYVSLKDLDVKTVEKQINDLVTPHFTEDRKLKTTYYLQPLSEVHTAGEYGDSVNYVAPQEILAGFVILALVTLFASVLNFINLATAQAVKRSKEIGIRKTLGSKKRQLVVQYLGETFLLVLVATLLAFTIGQFFINEMNKFLAKESFHIGYDITSVIFSVILGIMVTFLAGFYPSLVISGYNPIVALRNQISLKQGAGSFWLRKGLVIGQFMIANLLIISTIIVSSQMQYVKNKDLGFSHENVLTVKFPDKVKDKMPIIKNEFLKQNFVEKASISMSYPQGGTWGTSFSIEGIPYRDDMHARCLFVDESFLDLYEIPLLSGRNIRDQYTSDTTLQVLASEEAAKVLGLSKDEIIGKELNFMGDWYGRVQGVVEDFHINRLQDKIKPVLLIYKPSQMQRLNLKLASEPNKAEFDQIESIFRALSPTGFFEADVLRDNIKDSYVVENLIFGVFQIFSTLAVLIGVFGLYGLVSFMSHRNNKSISIRKVFGASTADVLFTFGKEFGSLLLIAFVLACPLSYLISAEWLNDFEYQIGISPYHFLSGFMISLLITGITIGHRSYKVATSNPVDTLRYE